MTNRGVNGFCGDTSTRVPPMVCFPRHALHVKGLQRQIGVGTLGTKSASRPGDKPDVNRSSTGRFVPPTVYIGFLLFALPKRCSGRLSSMPWRARGTVVSCANKHVGVPSCRARPAQPPRRAPPDSTRPWCVRVLDSTSIEYLALFFNSRTCIA